MVAQLEERLLKTPNEPQIVEQLVDFYRDLSTDKFAGSKLAQTLFKKWLVARECLSNATMRGFGSKLGERALEGACRQTGMSANFSSTTAQSSSVISTDSRATRSILGIVGNWRFEDHPADEVYSVLKGIVLPASRPAEIAMNAFSSTFFPQTFVDWAIRAEKLDELKEEIDRRVATTAFKDVVAPLIAMIEIARQSKSSTTDSIAPTLEDPR